MIPFLYEATETAFTTACKARLVDCVSCVVTEERNGVYECSFVYPMTGRHYEDIEIGCYIGATHDDDGDVQPFKIYYRSAPLDGAVEFHARHLSYALSNVIVSPFSAANVQAALQGIGSNAINTNLFTFSTDKTTVADFSVDEPASVRSVMGGQNGSLLDIYGGEWDFDKYNVYLKAARGTASGITIRYGKNLVDINQTIDAGGLYNALVPFWRQEVDGVDTLVTLPEHIVAAAGVTDPVPVVMDFTMDFEEQPTEAQLRAAAAAYLADQEPWTPPETLKVNFIALWQTSDYESVANLLKLRLCDTVSVYYPLLGVTAHNIKVIKTVYNTLAEKYDSIELGQPQASFAQVLTQKVDKSIASAQTADRGFFDAAITAATDLLTGANGGHVVIKRDANGEPQEILIMDTTSELTATNILRINLYGIGFSTDGGNTYSTAWNIDGQFVADFITSGTLRAIMLEGPTVDTYWNLASGKFHNWGQSSVTAQVETSSGSYTPVTYSIDHVTEIYQGLIRLLAKINGNVTEEELFRLGLAADGMNYKYYDAAGASDNKSFPYAELNLEGPRVDGHAGTTPGYQTSDFVTYIPKGLFTPDYIELGQAGDMQDGNGDSTTGLPNRNLLHLGAGWANYQDAIWFHQFYKTEQWTDGHSTYKNRYLNYKRRLAWELIPWDDIRIGDWCGCGILTNNKCDIRITLPFGRPISSECTALNLAVTVDRVMQNDTVLVSTPVDISLHSQAQAGGLVYSWSSTGLITLYLRKPDESAWSNQGTNRAAVTVQLTNIVVGAR